MNTENEHWKKRNKTKRRKRKVRGWMDSVCSGRGGVHKMYDVIALMLLLYAATPHPERRREKERKAMSQQEVQAGSHRSQHKLRGPAHEG